MCNRPENLNVIVNHMEFKEGIQPYMSEHISRMEDRILFSVIYGSLLEWLLFKVAPLSNCEILV